MAHFNACSQLVNQETLNAATEEYKKILASGQNPLDVMLQMQHSLQKKVAEDKPLMNQDPDNIKTCGQLVDWFRIQKDSFDDEFRELLTSVGGMSHGENVASGVWKAWKSNNVELRNTSLDDMKEDDRVEMEMECVDLTHFYLNLLIGLQMNAEKLFTFYYLKNAENFERQKRNY